MTGLVLLLGFLPLAWFFLHRPKTPPRAQMRVAASSLWMLDHFCISLGTVMREWPELEEVRLNLEALNTLDNASIASLKGALEATAKARVRFRLDGYTAGMARLAIASGIDSKHLGSPRPAPSYPRQLLH
ncbi:MAG TPA: hypothetical protein VNG33_14080 [Polyangiaceae bacterium]|nr:hypothetical protein [Polyangiaceae bacterium]